MGITMREFQVAMETYGAKRIDDQRVSIYNVNVPCFEIKNVQFIHSGSYYVAQGTQKVPKEIMDKAMAEFNENESGGYNYFDDNIYSVVGILALALMLENKFSQEALDNLVNRTYDTLFTSCTLLQNNTEVIQEGMHSEKMREIFTLLTEFDNLVNPFGDSSISLKRPSEFLAQIIPSIGFSEKYASFSLSTADKRVSTSYNVAPKSKHYSFAANRKSALIEKTINVTHYFNESREDFPGDEVVSIYVYTTHAKSGETYVKIDWRLSLKDGIIWKTTSKEKVRMVTESQLDIISIYLQDSIKSLKEEISAHVVQEVAK